MSFDSSYLAVDLDAFDANLDAIAQKAGVPVMAVLKADAYGHGVRMCSRYAAPLVDSFAAATLEEALTIRSEVPDKPILVLGKLFDEQIIAAAKAARAL